MSHDVTQQARMDPALCLRASKFRHRKNGFARTAWHLQIWSFLTLMLVMIGDKFEMSVEEAEWRITWASTDVVSANATGVFMYLGGLIYAIPTMVFALGDVDRLMHTVEDRVYAAKGVDP